MKYLVLFMICLTSVTLKAQTKSQNQETVVKAPRITLEKKLNNAIVTNNVSIKLIKVLQDSRCPKGVNCIRAGEVKVLIEVIEAGKIAKLKEVVIQANTHPDSYSLIHKDKDKNTSFFAVDLLPYPVYNTKTETKDYSLKIEVRK